MRRPFGAFSFAITSMCTMMICCSTGQPGDDAGTTKHAGGRPNSGIPSSKIIGEWWWPFSDGYTIAQIQSSAPQVNYLSLVGALTGNGYDGAVHGGLPGGGAYKSEAELISDINAWKASGRIIVGDVTGAGSTAIVINDSTDVAKFMAVAVPVIKQLGLQGLDFDLENTPDAASLASIITQLKADFGSNFIIALDPRPFELRPGGVYRQVIQDAGINNIDLVQPQDYALAGDSLAAQRSYMDSDLADWTHNLVPANKLLIGSYDPQEGESLSTAVQTYTYYKEVYPTLRGSMFWETREDGSQLHWQWAAQMANAP